MRSGSVYFLSTNSTRPSNVVTANRSTCVWRTFVRQTLVAVILLIALVIGCESSSRCRTSVQPFTPEDRERAIESFDMVWTTIRDRHWDPKLGGIDWEAVRNELRPRVEAAKNLVEARLVLAEMIHRLKLSHFGIIPFDAYDVMQDAGAGPDESVSRDGARDGWSGIEPRVVGGEALVAWVDPSSPAAAAGIVSGMVLLEVDGVSADRRIRVIQEAHRDSTLCELYVTRGIEAMLSDGVGKEITLVLLDREDKRREFRLKLAAPRGEETTLGNLGLLRTWFESRRIDGDIGYIRFNMFANPSYIMKQFEAAIRSFMDTKGVIIDLRGNPGGIGAMAMGIAGWFLDEPATLGTMITRDATLKFAISPRGVIYSGPLAILIDSCSASTTEILAGGLQDIQRARVFGQPSAGAALPSIIDRLPNGDGFQYAFANYISASGKTLEGRGVIPDERVNLTRAGLLAGHDEVVDAAVAWIRSK